MSNPNTCKHRHTSVIGVDAEGCVIVRCISCGLIVRTGSRKDEALLIA